MFTVDFPTESTSETDKKWTRLKDLSPYKTNCTSVHSDNSNNEYWFPEFLNDVRPFESEYSFEWKIYLLRKNSKEVKKSSNQRNRFTFYTPNIVKCIFNMCRFLKQPPEVRYLAVDIFDRFLVEHFFGVAQASVRMNTSTLTNWQIITERILTQSLLRILSCIQLSVKLSCHSNVITMTTIKEITQYLRQSSQYTKKCFIKSEARIYHSLNYNIPINSPLTYLEMFFEDFQKSGFIQLRIPLHNFLKTCICVLDVAIIHHQQIYLNLARSEQCGLEEEPPKSDFVSLSASVIFAGAVLEDPSMRTSDLLLPYICSIGECKKSHIQGLGKQILNIILGFQT